MNLSRFCRHATIVIAFAATASSFATTTIITRLNPGYDPVLVSAAHGLAIRDVSPGHRYYLFEAVSEQASELAEEAMVASGEAAWAEDDEDLAVTESTNGKGGGVPQLGPKSLQTQYSLNNSYTENTHLLQQINWSYTPMVADQGVRVAILDTGLSPFQPLLWSKVVASATMIPRESNAWDYRTSPTDFNKHQYPDVAGHGTMVAGIIAMLAPDAELIIVRVCDNYGRSNAWKIIKGLAFSLENGAMFANMSFGSVIQPAALEEVIKDGVNQGLLCIAPLGNNNLQQALYPSRTNETLAVSGVDGFDIKADFSNWHGTADMSAPATGIKSAWWNGQMAIWSGTSFAAPIVTGCLAEILKNRTPLDPIDILDATNAMGDNIDQLNPNYIQKLGRRVNLERMRTVLMDL